MDRRIPLQGLTNFRDLGGYRTADGRQVRWRTVFRSDTLASLTDRDMETVCDLGVTTACDLRYGEEREAEPSRFLGHERVEVLALGLNAKPGTSFVDSFEAGADMGAAARDYLLQNYRQYPVLYAEAYRTIFRRVLDGHRVVVHCTAGKDRAGTAAAMILTALGVPRETVLEDYLLTNACWDRGGRVQPGMDPEMVKAVFSAHEEYLAAAFATVDDDFGGPDAYLREHIGLDAAILGRLREICLD